MNGIIKCALTDFYMITVTTTGYMLVSTGHLYMYRDLQVEIYILVCICYDVGQHVYTQPGILNTRPVASTLAAHAGGHTFPF